MKNNNIPEYLLCPTPELARQVLEKIERESDLRFEHDFKKDEITSSGFYPELVIRTVALEGCGNPLDYSQVKFYEKKGITNFTKAEDYLNNKSMTNKTWDNLEVGWSLVTPNGGTREILAICDRLIFIEKHSGDCYPYGHTKEYFMGAGYKIKGASEEKPSIDEVIKILEESVSSSTTIGMGVRKVEKAIEMLKKLKS